MTRIDETKGGNLTIITIIIINLFIIAQLPLIEVLILFAEFQQQVVLCGEIVIQLELSAEHRLRERQVHCITRHVLQNQSVVLIILAYHKPGVQEVNLTLHLVAQQLKLFKHVGMLLIF